ncbi:hypothetical protein [Acidocella sp.]|uniref:hypothetical protein n=1 Tax=Acidocella sp. TaxID=50710 RepID=UPI003CFE401B
MNQIQTLSKVARIAAPRKLPVPAGSHAKETFIIEDGWVFREHHGKYVECICRSDEIAKLPGGQRPASRRV